MWGISSVVERRIPNPQVAGSIPAFLIFAIFVENEVLASGPGDSISMVNH